MDPFWMMQQCGGPLPPPTTLLLAMGSTPSVLSQSLLSTKDSCSPTAFLDEYMIYSWKTSNCTKVCVARTATAAVRQHPHRGVHPVCPSTWCLPFCMQRFCHDWSACPFVHPNEKCRRRSPKTFTYDAVACPDAKNVGGVCSAWHPCHHGWVMPQGVRVCLCMAL